MSRRSIFSFLFSLIIINATVLNAEEMVKSDLQIKGKIFLDWHTGLTDSTDSESGDKKNTFAFDRVYLTCVKELNDLFTMKVTVDVENSEVEEDGHIKSRYKFYLKKAYLQTKKTFGPVDTKLLVGMIGTPIIGFTEKIADQRWIVENLINGSKSIIPTGEGIDPSADMGLLLQLDIFKKLTFTGAAMNGEGYKSANESTHGESDEGKSYYAMLNFMPIHGLYLSGYYKIEETSVDISDDHKGYYGGGVAWKNKLISIGVNYIIPFEKVDGSTVKWEGTDESYDIYIIDAWMSLYLKTVIDMPIFVMSKFGLSEDRDQGSKGTTFFGAGLGYEFNKNVRTIAWYQQFDSEEADEDDEANPNKTFWIKAEIKW